MWHVSTLDVPGAKKRREESNLNTVHLIFVAQLTQDFVGLAIMPAAAF
jgi:hypothetical protein